MNASAYCLVQKEKETLKGNHRAGQLGEIVPPRQLGPPHEHHNTNTSSNTSIRHAYYAR
jgi:hypothetical protein